MYIKHFLLKSGSGWQVTIESRDKIIYKIGKIYSREKHCKASLIYI